MNWDILEFLVDLVRVTEHWRFLLCVVLAIGLCCVVCPPLTILPLQIAAGVVIMIAGLWLGASWDHGQR